MFSGLFYFDQMSRMVLFSFFLFLADVLHVATGLDENWTFSLGCGIGGDTEQERTQIQRTVDGT